MIIGYGGQLREARILARRNGSMRVAVEHVDDAVELQLFGANWYSEDLELVTFDFLLAADIPLVLPEAADRPRVARAAYGAVTV